MSLSILNLGSTRTKCQEITDVEIWSVWSLMAWPGLAWVMGSDWWLEASAQHYTSIHCYAERQENVIRINVGASYIIYSGREGSKQNRFVSSSFQWPEPAAPKTNEPFHENGKEFVAIFFASFNDLFLWARADVEEFSASFQALTSYLRNLLSVAVSCSWQAHCERKPPNSFTVPIILLPIKPARIKIYKVNTVFVCLLRDAGLRRMVQLWDKMPTGFSPH